MSPQESPRPTRTTARTSPGRVGLLCGGIPRGDLDAAGADAVYDDPAAPPLAALPDAPPG